MTLCFPCPEVDFTPPPFTGAFQRGHWSAVCHVLLNLARKTRVFLVFPWDQILLTAALKHTVRTNTHISSCHCTPHSLWLQAGACNFGSLWHYNSSRLISIQLWCYSLTTRDRTGGCESRPLALHPTTTRPTVYCAAQRGCNSFHGTHSGKMKVSLNRALGDLVN